MGVLENTRVSSATIYLWGFFENAGIVSFNEDFTAGFFNPTISGGFPEGL